MNTIQIIQRSLSTTILLFATANLNAQRIIRCSPNSGSEDLSKPNLCLLDALENAQPGDEIILAPGNYVGGTRSVQPFDNFSSFASDRDGTDEKPIILRGSSATNKPVITTKAGRVHSWYGINLTGNHWIIKDIEITNVAKGIVLDDASHCQLLGLKVSNVGEEAIHLRSGASNNLIKGCEISYTGQIEGKEGFGEAVYIGSDRKRHGANPGDADYPACDNNITEDCIIGPFITADAFDVKEGTENSVIRRNTFYAEGVTGANSGDSFIDLKGIYGYVYDNTFNINPNNDPNKDVSKLNAVIDVSNRTFGSFTGKTGRFSAIFDNTINIARSKSSIPTARIILDPEKQPDPSTDVHVYNNLRVPNTEWVLDPTSKEYIARSCPEWNTYRECPPALSTQSFENLLGFDIISNSKENRVSVIGLSENSTKEITIYDLNGRKLKNIISSDNVVSMDTSYMSAGIYIINIKTDSTQASKLIKI